MKPHLQDILAKLVQMTAGAGMFPGDDKVDQLWIEMDAAARAPDKGRNYVERIQCGVSLQNNTTRVTYKICQFFCHAYLCISVGSSSILGFA